MYYFLYSIAYEARISSYVTDTSTIKEWSERSNEHHLVCVTFNVEEDYLPLFVEQEFYVEVK